MVFLVLPSICLHAIGYLAWNDTDLGIGHSSPVVRAHQDRFGLLVLLLNGRDGDQQLVCGAGIQAMALQIGLQIAVKGRLVHEHFDLCIAEAEKSLVILEFIWELLVTHRWPLVASPFSGVDRGTW